MNYKFILFIILIFHVACVNQQIDTKTKSLVSENFFSNKGFTLIYTDELYEEKLIKGKIENRSLIIFQKNLKKNSNVKITNLINSKYII